MTQKTTDPAQAFRDIVEKKLQDSYGHVIPPKSYVTSFGIRTLDAFLGGGLGSSMINLFQSTPESGKSTTALQFASIFLESHPDSMCLYLDRESVDEEKPGDAIEQAKADMEDRIETFGIDRTRFLYQPVVADVKEMYGIIIEAIEVKKAIQKKLNKEYYLYIIWDSIASTPSSKHKDAEDPKSIIGYKANELSLYLAKLSVPIAMERVTITLIDQIRANIQVEMPWQKAANQKTVGEFGNVKAATNIQALNHNVRQWLFLSKAELLKSTDPMGVDGWVN